MTALTILFIGWLLCDVIDKAADRIVAALEGEDE